MGKEAMIKLTDLLKEGVGKPRKGDVIIRWDDVQGKIHNTSRGIAYCKYPDTHPSSFEPVPFKEMKFQRSAGKIAVWQEDQ